MVEERVRSTAIRILSLRERLNGVYAEHTGQSVKAISEALERDNFMTAEAAKDFGIIDKVITKREVPDDAEAEAKGS